jgi:hypothetical protein
LICCGAHLVVTGGAGMPDTEEVSGSARVSPVEKGLHGFVAEAFYEQAPMCERISCERNCLFLPDSVQNRYIQSFNYEDVFFWI